MKVFISVGMSGRDKDDIANDIERAYEHIRMIYGDDAEIVHNWYCPPPSDSESAGRCYYLSRAIELLGTCDVCYFDGDWRKSKGCLIEMLVCKLYGISVAIEPSSRKIHAPL